MELTTQTLQDWRIDAQGLFWQTENQKRIVRLVDELETLQADQERIRVIEAENTVLNKMVSWLVGRLHEVCANSVGCPFEQACPVNHPELCHAPDWQGAARKAVGGLSIPPRPPQKTYYRF